MSKNNLTGRRVAITGGARGIGRATAEAFIARGATVVIGDIDAPLAEKTAAEVAEKAGGTIIGLGLDVTDDSSFAAFLAAAELELGGLDVLVNNAGIMPSGPFLEESDAVTDRQININLRAVITGSKLAGTRFAANGSGHIVNIASLAGIIPSPGVAVYCATKAAVVALGDALHQELAPQGIVVTTIAPSVTRTDLISGLPMNVVGDKLATVNPEDIAAAVIDHVNSGNGGLSIVPRVFGAVMKTSHALIPAALRNRLYKFAGLDANLHVDDSARKAYRDRTEPGQK